MFLQHREAHPERERERERTAHKSLTPGDLAGRLPPQRRVTSQTIYVSVPFSFLMLVVCRRAIGRLKLLPLLVLTRRAAALVIFGEVSVLPCCAGNFKLSER